MVDNIKIKLDVESGKAKEQVRDFEQFLKTRPYLAKKLKESGQEGVAADKVSWFKALGSIKAAESARRDQQRFMSGSGDRSGYGWRELGGGIARDIAHGGLHAAGPAGHAASRAMGAAGE